MDFFIKIVIKTLDIIHDILCPFFKDDKHTKATSARDEDQQKSKLKSIE